MHVVIDARMKCSLSGLFAIKECSLPLFGGSILHSLFGKATDSLIDGDNRKIAQIVVGSDKREID